MGCLIDFSSLEFSDENPRADSSFFDRKNDLELLIILLEDFDLIALGDGDGDTCFLNFIDTGDTDLS